MSTDAISWIPKVWIIDDKHLDSIIIKLSIEKINRDANIVMFKNGMDALNKLVELTRIQSDELPDIIFLDLNMPVMNGWEFLSHLKDLNIPSLRVFIVSGKISAADAKKSESEPLITSYFHKPISIDDLKSIFDIGRQK